MNLSFKPTSITLPEPNPFFSHTNKSNPGTPLQHSSSNNNTQSVSFNTDIDLNLTNASFNSSNSQSPRIRPSVFPKTPFPTNVNPLDSVSILTSPLCSPHAGLPLTELSIERFQQFLSNPEQLLGTLILDVRPGIQFLRSHIRTSVNVCIPTTLLRRSTFNIQKLSSSLTNEADKNNLSNWKQRHRIVFVDASSSSMNDSTPLHYLSKKFMEQEAKVSLYWLNGGFKNFSEECPKLCESSKDTSVQMLPMRPKLSPSSLGPMTCPVPTINTDPNPFFDNIRQYNLASTAFSELIPIKLPPGQSTYNLPSFLQELVAPGGPQKMADSFNRLDQVEQQRLRVLLAAQCRNPNTTNPYSVCAGIEKGHKNRYCNIWPYEHTRVKLLEHATNDTNYINASYIHDPQTNYKYIATQGPMPTTFADFWQMTWEQNSYLILMLTKEEEGGRIRCHRYWPSSINCMKDIERRFTVTLLDERDCYGNGELLLRKILLKNLSTNSERVIIQICYTSWPDFGVPDDPMNILDLHNIVDHHRSLIEAKVSNSGPMIVHCSAGCGRTGAFCTIDCCLKLYEKSQFSNIDRVYELVNLFRDQRLSMVQTHRQLVFCYEAIIWYILRLENSQLQNNLSQMNTPKHSPDFPILDLNYNLDASNLPTLESDEVSGNYQPSFRNPKQDGFPFF